MNKVSPFHILIVMIVLVGLSVWLAPLIPVHTSATATSVPATVTPASSSQLIFQDLSKDNAEVLDMAGKENPSPLPGLGKNDSIIGQEGSDLVITTGSENYLYFEIYSPSTGKTVKIDSPVPDPWEPFGWGSMGSSIYVQYIYRDQKPNTTNFKVFKLEDAAFVAVRSINLDLKGYYDGRFTFTPDLATMIYHDSENPLLFYIVDSDTQARTPMTLKGVNPEIPFFSPDGTALAYFTDMGDAGHMCLITMPRTDLSAQKTVFCDLGLNQFVDVLDYEWSPDGQRLAISYYPDSRSEMQITIIDLIKSSYIDPIVAPNIRSLTWSPNSKYLAYFADPNHEPGIYFIALDGDWGTKMYGTAYWNENYTHTGTFPFWIDAWIN